MLRLASPFGSSLSRAGARCRVVAVLLAATITMVGAMLPTLAIERAAAAERRACLGHLAVATTRAMYVVGNRRMLYGCPAGRVDGITLFRSDFGTRVIQVAARRRMVAFAETPDGKYGTMYPVKVVDVVRRRACRTVTGTGHPGERGDLSETEGEQPTDLAVAPTGAVAFIAGPGYGPGYLHGAALSVEPWDGYEVMLSDADGTRQLAAGPDIEPQSLSMRGDRVVWRDSTGAHVAEVSPTPVRCTGRYW